tara:strand:- start:38 stop:781 length:744 start_codon:yes stop_codon:yes gene_type:complete
MADKAFGVKDFNLIGASGTPTIESPNNLNINAVNVAISTDITVAGKVSLGAGTSISSPGTNILALGTNSAERVRITSSGAVQVANGNLVFSTAGTGIDFSATGDASGMTSELLDDYEEGSWTPTDSTGGRTFGTDTWGLYTKVGRMVHASCYVDCANSHSTNANSIFTIAGLPFTPLDPGTGGFVGSPMFRYVNVESTTVNVSAYVTDATSGIRFYKSIDAGNWDAFLNSEVLSTTDFYIGVTYYVS